MRKSATKPWNVYGCTCICCFIESLSLGSAAIRGKSLATGQNHWCVSRDVFLFSRSERGASSNISRSIATQGRSHMSDNFKEVQRKGIFLISIVSPAKSRDDWQESLFRVRKVLEELPLTILASFNPLTKHDHCPAVPTKSFTGGSVFLSLYVLIVVSYGHAVLPHYCLEYFKA